MAKSLIARMECRLARKRKVKENLLKLWKIVGVVASVAGVVYLVSHASDDGDDDDSNDDYPDCDMCGTEMTEFDGCWWYTCPECGNRVRRNSNGTWTRAIFGHDSKYHKSDFELADFCRGGDLTED